VHQKALKRVHVQFIQFELADVFVDTPYTDATPGVKSALSSALARQDNRRFAHKAIVERP
jgi:hypothetical protein